MNPDELGETAIDPKTRRLAQISMSDVEDAAFTISQLMGKDPAPKWAELSTVTVSGEEGII
jgi:DNA gyrase/topoisomerase IV subunit B